MASVTQRTDLNPPVLNVLDLTNQAIEEGDRARAAAGPASSREALVPDGLAECAERLNKN